MNEVVASRTRELIEANLRLTKSNRKISENVQALSKSNASLEGFAFTASHDLQEPLRKIQAFAVMLKNKIEVHADEESIHLIDRIQASGQRMSMLIASLLDLSRLSAEQNIQLVSLNDAVQLALDTLELKISESSAVIQVDSLHAVYGDISQLSQLFQNLIANALRFKSDDRIPTIRITCAPVLGSDIAEHILPRRVADFYHKIEVADNGIGFSQENAEKIFEVFKRLHGRSTYEGTGIGLSICKQVVDNHHGVIYADGELDKGATFTVLLPIAGIR